MGALPLLVFADDWGRHPSSCQHLVRRLLERHPTYWVNTIGTRKPRLDLATLRRGLEKVVQWSGRPAAAAALPANLRVLNPRMWPSFSTAFDRRLNRRLLGRPLAALAGALPEPPVAITTLPVAADLVGVLPVRRWVYYCVDDFAEWPGLDGAALRRMEADLLRRVDTVVAVSEPLRDRLARMGRESHLLTHGVDPGYWVRPSRAGVPSLDGLERPLVVFWGVVDRRMDLGFVRALSQALPRGTVVFAGPEQDPDPALRALPRVARLGSLAFEQLPALAAEAAVLVMPYADLPVTRAMQPLKLKEYLATGRPVVVRDLPATRGWADCLDLAATPEDFAAAVLRRLEEGLPAAQQAARERLAGESWSEKARQFEEWALAAGTDHPSEATNKILEVVKCIQSSDSSRERVLPAARTPTPLGNGRRAPARVLHLRTVAGRGGGPEKTILNSPRFLRGRYEMRLAYIRPEGDPAYDMPERARQMGVDLVDIPERTGVDPRTLWRLLRQVREFRPDILHAHDYKTDILAVLLGRWCGARTLTTLHGYVSRGGRLEIYYRLGHWALRRMDHVVAVSEDLYQMLPPLGIPEARRSLVPNAIDVVQFARRRSTREAREALGMDPARLVVGAVGRLAPEKGFDLLVQAFDRVLAAGLDAELVIAGEGEERPRLEALIAQLGRGDRVRLLGHQSEVRPLYEALDVFALSSRREGLPNVVLEGMALEVPVLATRVAGVPGVIQDGTEGLLIEPGSVDELTAALKRLLADAGLRRRLARNARNTIETRFSFAARMDRIGSIYDRLLTKKPR
jgi:glycosyltransferase involved in cell wall biosynthesis